MWLSKKFFYASLTDVHKVISEIARGKAREETVSVFQAFNRVLAEDIISDVDIPPFNVSHVDGYAIRAEETLKASATDPVSLRVIGRIYLGEEWRGRINAGESVYISTGSRLPDGANAVVPVESATQKGDFIEIRKPFQPNENVTPAGADVKRGEKIFERGHNLRPQDIKLLADMKKWMVKVYRKPVVALASIGNELTDRIEEADGKKLETHSMLLSFLINEAGGIPLNLGIVPDDIDSIVSSLKTGFEKADVVATIGGSSLGERDYVVEALNTLRANVLVRGIRVQPGRVTSMGIFGDKPVVMLPGHIQSMLVGCYFVLLPLIRLMSGQSQESRDLTLKAKISQRLVLKEYLPFKRIRFVRLKKDFKYYIAEPVLGDSSLASVIVKADGFIIIPEGKEIVEEGEEVEVHFLKGLFY